MEIEINKSLKIETKLNLNEIAMHIKNNVVDVSKDVIIF